MDSIDYKKYNIHGGMRIMNKYKKIISLLSTLMISALMLSSVSAESKTLDTSKSISTISESNLAISFYKTVMNDPSWRENENRAERGKMLQLPEYMLKKMTTDELIEAVLNYPFFTDIYAFDNIEDGIDVMFEDFNGIKELFKRDNAAKEILKAYQREPVIKDEKNIIYDDIFRLNNLEILLLNEDVIPEMNDRQLSDLYNTISDKHKQKIRSKIYGEQSEKLIYELLDVEPNEKKAQIEIKRALFNIKSEQSVQGQSGYVKTPKGNKVNVTFYSSEPLSFFEIAAMKIDTAVNYPKAVELRNPSGKYNCHSYAWYSQSQNNNAWMPDPHMYWIDGSYVASNIQKDSRMVYFISFTDSQGVTRKITDHSAIVVERLPGITNFPKYYMDLVTVKSKWGSLGLYRHNGADCPYIKKDNCNEAKYYNRVK